MQAIAIPRRLGLISMAFGLACSTSLTARADTAIETETAQIGLKGEGNFSQAFEYEHAKDGSGQGTLTQFEYGLSDRSEILIEPFFYVGISPKGGQHETGMGDLEITPSYKFVDENAWMPAMLVALKVKVPTGSKRVEGTGKFDYYPYLILGQHFHGWTFNANVGVNYAQPVDSKVFQKTAVWDIEAEREVLPKLTLFLEAFSAEDAVKTLSTSAEYQFTPRFNAFASFGRTEEHSNVVRVGFNVAVGPRHHT